MTPWQNRRLHKMLWTAVTSRYWSQQKQHWFSRFLPSNTCLTDTSWARTSKFLAISKSYEKHISGIGAEAQSNSKIRLSVMKKRRISKFDRDKAVKGLILQIIKTVHIIATVNMTISKTTSRRARHFKERRLSQNTLNHYTVWRRETSWFWCGNRWFLNRSTVVATYGSS